MARILFAWELGKGFGHLAPYRDYVAALRKAGHDVVFAARDVANADRVFAPLGVPILQAPVALRTPDHIYRVQYIFAQLAHNAGLGDVTDMFGRVKAWLHLFNYASPDVVVFDHSPTAMLAARAFRCRRIVSGSGFLVPPPGEPQPLMRYWQKVSNDEMLRVERQLLAGLNHALGALKCPPLARFSDLYDADLQFLLSPPELDHYPQRQGGNYVGQAPSEGYGAAPRWPRGNGRRVFAYLYPFKTLPALLEALQASGAAVLVHGPEIPAAVRQQYATDSVVFVTEPLDMRQVGAECDGAVTNGTFGTTTALLLAGKPVLMIPQNLERSMVARRVIGLGAGIGLTPAQSALFGPRLAALLNNSAYAAAARAFADRHAGATVARQTASMLAQTETLLKDNGTSAPRA